jgi:hypothetical protein
MNEPPEPQRRSAVELKPVAQKDSERERRAMDDRYEAARRWIGDDEESAVRGID